MPALLFDNIKIRAPTKPINIPRNCLILKSCENKITPNIRAKNGVMAFNAPDKELGISAPALANKYAGIKLPMVPEMER